MEHFTRAQYGFGSDKWDKLDTEENRRLEELLDSVVVEDEVPMDEQPAVFQVQIMQRWIEFAAEHGDLTYRKYTDKPLFFSTLQYLGSIHSPIEFPNRRIEANGKDNHESEEGQVDSGPGSEKLIQGLDQV